MSERTLAGHKPLANLNENWIQFASDDSETYVIEQLGMIAYQSKKQQTTWSATTFSTRT